MYAGYAIPQSSKNPDAAVALINYMAQASVDKQITAATQALSPVRSSSSAIHQPPPPGPPRMTMPTRSRLWTGFREPEVSTAIGTQAQAIFLGNATPKEAANTVQSAFQTLVKTGKSFFKQ